MAPHPAPPAGPRPSAPPPVRLVMVGGGPRALGILERLAANAPDLLAQAGSGEGARLRIDVVDPHALGAGRIWSLRESPLLLMNSRARDVTAWTDGSVAMDGPVVPGPTLAQWAARIREGEIPWPTAATALRAEIQALQPDAFASRRLQGLYLEWCAGQVLSRLPRGIEVHTHRTLATAVEEAADPAIRRVRLADGSALEADLLVLALGHTDARLTPRRHALAAFARRHGGLYVPPSAARDADLAAIDPGADVILRGMGLAFIDLVSLLTEGRGGAYLPDPLPGRPGRLRYEASGREPRLWAGSRRGVPHHAKVTGEGDPAGPQDLVHLSAAALAEREDAGGLLRFREDVLPLIAAEIHRAVPGAPAPEDDPDLRWLDDPLAALTGRDPSHAAVVRHIEEDLALRAGSAEHAAPQRALFQVLLRVTGALSELLPAERLHPDSAREHPAWWHSVFSFVDSGPPPHRLEQLLALERAGLLRFLGPRAQIVPDEDSGRFLARGLDGQGVAASALIDAFLPEQTLGDSTGALLRSLVGAENEDAGTSLLRGREALAAPGRLEIDARQRVIAPDGSALEGVWANGAWTSELPLGAFARPLSNAPAFRRNDALAREVLEAAAEHAGTEAGDAASARRPALGILGAGRLGTALARHADRSGIDVLISGRRSDTELRAAVPGARPVDIAGLAAADVVVLAVPLHAVLEIDPAVLAGAVVIDATNAWGEQDAARLAASGLSSSQTVAAHLAGSSIVKTLNHLSYHDVEEQGAHGTARRALALAGDDAAALAASARLLRALGAEPVVIGDLAAGRDLEPGEVLFHGWSTPTELESLLARRREEVRAASAA